MTIVSVGPTQNRSRGIPKQKAVFFQLCQLDATVCSWSTPDGIQDGMRGDETQTEDRGV